MKYLIYLLLNLNLNMSSTFKPKEKELTPPNNDTENIRVVDWLPDTKEVHDAKALEWIEK